MAKCDQCGSHENMPYNCQHCGGTYCSEHRLPENHACPGLEQWNDPDGVFDSGFDDSVSNRGGASGGVLGRLGVDTGAGSTLGYFRNNVAYLFLALIVVVYVLEFVVLTVRPDLFDAIFVLSTAQVSYAWTWVTSVFSHSPVRPTHILFNGIVLYFFGPIVERQVGSRKFAALFVISGAVAGLAQIGTGITLGRPVSGVLGASGAILALLGVLAITSPDLKVLLFFFIPVSMRTLAIGYAALSVLGIAAQGSVMGNVAHMAHLAGLLIGLWYGNRIKDRVGGGPQQLNLGPGRGGGGPGGPGRL